MKKIKNIKKEYIVYIIVILCFITLSIIISRFHEPWSDEAHAWLIARDTSLKELFTFFLHVDGHPALWHIILKIFQFFGLPYSKMCIIPIIFSTLGIIIFEFKSKFPLIIKILLPFTYFIFYQYTIIARGYCLLFSILGLIASIWDKKYDKPYIFTILLILLINTEAYTYIFSGMLFLLYGYEIIIKKYNIKKYLPSIIIIALSFIITFLYVYPLKTNTFNPRVFGYFISDSFITPYEIDNIYKLLLSLIIIIYTIIVFYKTNKLKDLTLLVILLVPVLSFYAFFYYNIWHLGIPLLLFIFILWIQDNTKNKYISILLIITCLVQCYFSYKTISYDYYNNYSGSRDTANFINKYDYKNLKIYGIGFNSVAINAYFDKNIYSNWNKDLGFFFWNLASEYYNYNYQPAALLNSGVDIIIVSDFENHYDYPSYDYTILKSKYDYYHFEGNLYVENFKYYENGYTVYVAKELSLQ